MCHDSTGNACIEAMEQLTDTDFAYDGLNRNLFNLIIALYTRGTKPTYEEILREGADTGFIQGKKFDDVQRILTRYTSEQNISYWIGKVKTASKGRELTTLVRHTLDAMRKNKPVDEIIDHVNANAFRMALDDGRNKSMSGDDIADLGRTLLKEKRDKYRQMQEEMKAKGLTGAPIMLEGLPTGLPMLDQITLGYKPGDLIILGAETGKGKTAYALNTAKAICVDAHKPLLYVNTEMSDYQITQRWGSILSGVELQLIRSGAVTDEQYTKVSRAYTLLKNSGLYVEPAPNLNPTRLQLIAKRYHIQHQIEGLILDYVGRMDKYSSDKLSEWQMLEQTVKGCKILAQELEIAVIVLVQLNEDGALQGAKRMKNECDLMLKLLPLPFGGKKEDEEAETVIREIRQENKGKEFEPFNYRLLIDKARDAAGGSSIPLVFDKDRQQIRQAKPKEDVWAQYAG
jgi:replicative DNA helicase